MTDIHDDKILILDFGSQYTQLIARRLREIGVFSVIYAGDIEEEKIKHFGAKGIVLSGGPDSALTSDLKVPEVVWELDIPVLGICFGMQYMAYHFGGSLGASKVRQYGKANIRLLKSHTLFNDIDCHTEHTAWMSHGDHVEVVPDGFEVLAQTADAPVCAMAHVSKPWFGVQFHPEVTHTDFGMQMLKNFVKNHCDCEGAWTPEQIIADQITRIRETVGRDHVVLGLSGGVDSSVVAALLHEAIGEQLTCIFVDTGLLRLNEGDEVMATFAEHMGVNVRRVDASEQFLSALSGESDPEKKRKVIGKKFIDVFQEEASKIDNAKWLAQGTIYPDVIESAASKTQKAKVIKSHHNVGGLPETLHLKLLEPLRELFKDEVRKMGLALGLPESMIFRHPFPGPGLAVRILGEVKADYIAILQKADAIYQEILHEENWYQKLSQAFTVFLPVKSVGVKGDARAYEYVLALRAVTTQDFMTADAAEIPFEILKKASSKIINEVDGVARVTYDISSKPPATIEWE